MSAQPPPLPVFSDEHLRQLAAARKGARKVRRTIRVASFDGWAVGVFGCLTLFTGLTDPSSLLMGAGMGAVAFVELRAAARLRRLEATGVTRTLAINQLALAAILILYAAFRLHAEMTGVSPYRAYYAADPQLTHMLQPIENIGHLVAVALYGGMIAVALFAQGGLALFYFSRGKHIDAYLTRTPAWIVAMQQSGIAL